MSLRRTAAAVAISAFALGGLAACDNGKEDGRNDPAPTSSASSSAAAPGNSVPSAQELSDILNRASDPAVPTDQKVNLVEGGQEAPELFDQISKLKAEKNANVVITDSAAGDIPGTALANAVIQQAGQQDIQVQAQFINQDGQWKLQKSFACALITNAGLQAPPSCAAA